MRNWPTSLLPPVLRQKRYRYFTAGFSPVTFFWTVRSLLCLDSIRERATVNLRCPLRNCRFALAKTSDALSTLCNLLVALTGQSRNLGLVWRWPFRACTSSTTGPGLLGRAQRVAEPLRTSAAATPYLKFLAACAACGASNTTPARLSTTAALKIPLLTPASLCDQRCPRPYLEQGAPRIGPALRSRHMGLRDYLRRRHERERAIPEPGSANFESAVSGSALPGSEREGVSWASVGDAKSAEELGRRAAARLGAEEPKVPASEAIDLRGTGARGQVEEVLREHGVDPDRHQTIDASKVPGLGEAIMAVLKTAGVRLPGPVRDVGGGFGVATEADLPAQLEALARARDEGRITAAEFEAQKRRLLG